MRLALVVLVSMVLGGIAAGYYGIADEIADAFKWVALSSFCAFLATSLLRSVRSHGSRPSLTRLHGKVRRVTM
jgi:hypothetical protein